jgi:eukaryotic-like serine/threonine-protein kinase
MSDVIRGYKILNPFKMAGGGRCTWTFATKEGQQYFIKKYLAPKYPTPESPGSDATKQRKLKACRAFESNQLKLINAIKDKVGLGGNLVFTIDFFREGPEYYKVTEKVDVASLTPAEAARLDLLKRVMILLTITNSMSILHSENIVHGDLKPDNILIKYNTDSGLYVAKLIDFDDSYFSGEAPDNSTDGEGIVGTMEYYSPELGLHISGDSSVKISDLRLPSDIFTLGVIFSEYLTGKKPTFNEKHQYAWQSAARGEAAVMHLSDTSESSGGSRLVVGRGFKHTDTAPKPSSPASQLTALVNNMLDVTPAKRPTVKMMLDELKSIRDQLKGIAPVPSDPPPPPPPVVKERSDTSGVLIVNFKKSKDK